MVLEEREHEAGVPERIVAPVSELIKSLVLSRLKPGCQYVRGVIYPLCYALGA